MIKFFIFAIVFLGIALVISSLLIRSLKKSGAWEETKNDPFDAKDTPTETNSQEDTKEQAKVVEESEKAEQ